ncbi:hypothetical protein F4861DRAFT_540683 [Xylaria intraflava]|nr:hypothetical protein F4861DRAFT_540683 [Xylaria intraflava]
MAPSVCPAQRYSTARGLPRPVSTATCTNPSSAAMRVPRHLSLPRSKRRVSQSNMFSQPQLVSPRASVRFSTYSAAPSLTPTVQTADSAHAEIRDIESGLARMENKALSQQRVVLSEEKTENLGKLALGAKLDRALDRRMTGQDAEMRPRKSSLSEKEKVAQ